ncbi:MGDG synthase family glycosyltransferase [Streptomyces sp. NBC_01435]|uniref:MGDG synthase family glycosyltransferase n=1 Tax=Streptomyces sp. NBC_01435 TaxID=2903865 RepID=UPI002E36AA6A|nr:glycosyltransferase [Streptomyces sp. NBC_01435]
MDRHDFLDLLPGPIGRLARASYHRLLTLAQSGYQRIYAATEHRRPGPLPPPLRSTERALLRSLPLDTTAVVATYPAAGQVLGTLRRQERLHIPVITYLTDFSVHALWVAHGVDLHLAVHEIPAGQAREQGAAAVTVTGPVVDRRFSPSTNSQRRAARERFGLPANAPLALLVAGSWGVGPVRRAAAEIRDSGAAVPVVVCGRNQTLAKQLRADGIEHAFGWTDDMPGLMYACDVLVQNAGGLTSLEAFSCGLPVVSYRCIPGHGQTNAAALHEAGLAPWVREPADLKPILTELTEGLRAHRQRQAGLACTVMRQDRPRSSPPPPVVAPRPPCPRPYFPRRVATRAASPAASPQPSHPHS